MTHGPYNIKSTHTVCSDLIYSIQHVKASTRSIIKMLLYTNHLPKTTDSIHLCIAINFRCVRKIAKIDLLPSSCPSVDLNGTTRLPKDGFSLNLISEYFSKNFRQKFKFHYNLTRMTGTLHEDQCIFTIISRSFLLRMRNVSDIRCRENQNTYFMFNKFFPPKIVPFTR